MEEIKYLEYYESATKTFRCPVCKDSYITIKEFNINKCMCYECVKLIKNKNKEDIINKPSHYHDGVQPIEVIETNFEELETNGFLKGNVIKYVCRSNKKGKELEDLKKAQWNLNKLIERLEK